MSHNIPPDFRRSCLGNARLSGAGGFHVDEGGAMQSHVHWGFIQVCHGTEIMQKHVCARGIYPGNTAVHLVLDIN